MHPSNFHRGDPAPWFVFRGDGDRDEHFDAIAGRYVVMGFLGALHDEAAATALRAVLGTHRTLFDDLKTCFVGISTEPEDQRPDLPPGMRHIRDFDLSISRLYGAAGDDDPLRYTRFWLVLDPMLRVLRVAPLDQTDAVMAFVAALPPVSRHAGSALPAPILVVPRVFEPRFCQHLIGLYAADGGDDSGFNARRGGADGRGSGPVLQAPP